MHLIVLLLISALTCAEDSPARDGDVVVPEPLSGPQRPPSSLSENDDDDDYDAPPVDPLPPDVHAPAFPKLSPAEDQSDLTTEDPVEDEEDFDLPTKKPESVSNVVGINRTEIEQEGMIISSTDDYLDVSENGSFTGENSIKTEMSSETIKTDSITPNDPTIADVPTVIPNAIIVRPEQIVVDETSIDEKKTVDDRSESLSASERKESLEESPIFGNPKEIKDEQPFIVRAQARDSLGKDHFISEDLSKTISKKKGKSGKVRIEQTGATIDRESSHANKVKVSGGDLNLHEEDKEDLIAAENRAIDDFFNGVDMETNSTPSPTAGPFLKIDSASKGKNIVIGYTPDRSSKRLIIHAYDLDRMKMREIGAESSSSAKNKANSVTPDTEITSTLPTSTSKITNAQLAELLKAEQSTSKTLVDAEHLDTVTSTDNAEKVIKFGDLMEIMSKPGMHNRRNMEVPASAEFTTKKPKKDRKKKKLDMPSDSPLLEKLPIKKLVGDSTKNDETATVGSLPWDTTILPGTVINLEEASQMTLPNAEDSSGPSKKKNPNKENVRKSKTLKSHNETSTISITPADDFPKPKVSPDKEIQLKFPVPLSVLPTVPKVLAANETFDMGINFVPLDANSTSIGGDKSNVTVATPLKLKKKKKVPPKSAPKKDSEMNKNTTLEDFPLPKDLNIDASGTEKSSNIFPSEPLEEKVITPDLERLEIKHEESMDSLSQKIEVTNPPSTASSTTAEIPSKPHLRVEKVSVSGLSEFDGLGTNPAFLLVETAKTSKIPTDKQHSVNNDHNLIISLPSDLEGAKKSNSDESQPVNKPLILNLPLTHPLPLNITITRKRKSQRKHSKSSSYAEDASKDSAPHRNSWKIKMRPKSELKLEQSVSAASPQAAPELESLTPEEKAFNEGRAKSEDQPAKLRSTRVTTPAMRTTTTEGMYVTAPGERTTVPLEVLHFPTEEEVASADEPILSDSFEEMVEKTLREPEAKTMEFSLQEEEDFLKATIPPSDLDINQQQSDLPEPNAKDSLFSNADFIKKIDYRPNGEILSTQTAGLPVTKEKWKPYQFDCKLEVDDKGALCADWAVAGLCTSNRPTMFLFCRKTCLCSGPPRF